MEVRKKTGKKSGKSARYFHKKGINLIQNEEKKKHLLLTIVAALLVVVLLELAVKYGVLDLYAKLSDARDRYDDQHVKYVAAQNELRDYDDVLLEYRTYSRDWMEKDTSGKYVSVDRRDVLDLIESKMMKKGQIMSASVKGMDVNIQMTGMNLKQISQMCAELETSPIVASAILMSAGTVKDTSKPTVTEDENGEPIETGEDSVSSGSVLTFQIRIRLQSEEKKEG